MSAGVVVQKFGGSSVRNAERIMEAARKAIRAKQSGSQVILVVSAQGTTTDDLIAKAHEISPQPSAREMDMLLATGEQISIALVAMAIHELGEKAISFTGPQIGIVTDSVHRKARIKKIDIQRLKAALDVGQIVVLAGFQGMDEQYDITTLGRGGSDTTAVAIAAALRQSGLDVECEIYTDVDGVYTTDPRIVPGARKIDYVSYDEMLEMASMGAGVMHSRSIEFAKKFQVPLMVRNAASDATGTWIIDEADWMGEIPVAGVALAADEARITLEGIPDQPGVGHQLFSALAAANVAVDMIAQSVGDGVKTTIGFTVISTELERATRTIKPLVADLGATMLVAERVSKISVVGAGMRSVSGVAEKMFGALAAEGVNMTMITTGDIKISVLVEETGLVEDSTEPVPEKIKKSHEESRKAVIGRRALRAVHNIFRLAEPRKGAGRPTIASPPEGFRPRAPISRLTENADREAAVTRLDGMEDILISGVHLDLDQSRITVFDLPDRPGVCATVFDAVASSGILVDMIVQNVSSSGRAELSFTVPRNDLTRALKRTQDVTRTIDPGCRTVGDGDIAVLYFFGVGMRTHTGVARTLFGALAELGINIAMINSSEVCVGVVVDKTRGPEALAHLRQAFKV